MSELNIDIKFIDTSDWQELQWYSSGGTRKKMILQAPDGSEYYFKCSERKKDENGNIIKEYKFEFWNEIIAYQLGKSLGLNMLRYDVAIHNEEIGCLSPKMNKSDDEELIEVGRFMTAINEKFLPENNIARKEYTFQLLEKVIDYFNLSEYWNCFFQTLLFDAIIGNTDRHQENWSFLGKTSFFGQQIDFFKKEVIHDYKLGKLPKLVKKISNYIIDFEKQDINKAGKQTQLLFTRINSFAPIYDNGSSLARELTNEKIDQLLKDDSKINDYIQKGYAELHWENIKLNHFKLIEKLVNSSYTETLKSSSLFLNLWNDDAILMILKKIDVDLPENWNEYQIPENRKKLIINIVNLRFQKLITLLND